MIGLFIWGVYLFFVCFKALICKKNGKVNIWAVLSICSICIWAIGVLLLKYLWIYMLVSSLLSTTCLIVVYYKNLKELQVSKKTFIIKEIRIVLIIAAVVIVVTLFAKNFTTLSCQEYVAGTGNIKGDVNTEYYSELSADFEIGANKFGYAVFKDPVAALEELKEEYSLGIALIQEEYDLPPLTIFTYQEYGIYGWQVSTGTEEAQEQAAFVTGFMDIFENSFEFLSDFSEIL